MRRLLKRAVTLLLGLALIAFVVAWLLPPSRTSIEQKRHEDALLGKNCEQVQAIFGRPPVVRLNELDVQKRRADGTTFPEGEATIAFWNPGPLGRQDVILVAFDKMGTATRVSFLDGTSLSQRLRRWLPF
jgi:hypothetical protein